MKNTIKIQIDGKWVERKVSDNLLKNIKEETKPKFYINDWITYLGPIKLDGSDLIKGRPYRIKEVLNSGYILKLDANTPLSETYTENVKLAPVEDVERHLCIQASVKGYKPGIQYKSLTTGDVCTRKGNLTYYSDFDMLTDHHGGSIYLQGKWAEIIEEDKIFIGDYPVTFLSDGDFIKIGCHTITFPKVKKIYKTMVRHRLKKGKTLKL